MLHILFWLIVTMAQSTEALVTADTRLLVRRMQNCRTVAQGWNLWQQLFEDDHPPDPPDLVAAELLNLCAKHSDAKMALQVVQLVPHSEICRSRAISILGGCGQYSEVLHVLNREPKLTSAGPYNSAIAACGKSKQWESAVSVLDDMPDHLVTTVTVNAALTVLRRAKRPRECLALLQRARWPKAPLDRNSYHTALSCLLEEGCMKEACRLILAMEDEAAKQGSAKVHPNTDTYSRLAAGLKKWPKTWNIVQELLADKIGKEISPVLDFQQWTLKKHLQGKKAFWELGTLAGSAGEKADDSTSDLMIGLQPNRSPAVNGIKLVFYQRDAATQQPEKLGYLLMINSYQNRTSQFLGQFVDQANRGQGLAKIWFAIWLRICLDAGLTPCTGKIRKPLLCLVLDQTFGMIPQVGGVEAVLSPGDKEGEVVLWSPSGQSLEGAISPLDLKTQNIRISVDPPDPPGRKIVLNCDFRAPEKAVLETATASILQNRFRLHELARKEDLGKILLGA